MQTSESYIQLVRKKWRYKSELAKDADWRKPQNGSTFFNSGYVDYLDGNYEPQTTTNSNIDESMDDLDDLF